MPNLNPLEPGDVPYPQYSVTTTQFINDSQAIVKGTVYSKNNAGNLVIPTTTLVSGVYQARASVDASATAIADLDAVQVLGPRSRILMPIADGITLHEGREVILVVASNTVTTGGRNSNLYLGRVFEIYTKDADGNKQRTATGVATVADSPLVIIETVGE